MKWWKYNTIYATGSSLTAGGGMNDSQNKLEYKRLHNIEIGDEKNCTYPRLIANHFGCELIHDAQSGAGAPRLIRRTYNYIEKIGLENAKKTLFLFEITDPIHRVDFYLEEIGDYVIVNVRYDDDTKNVISSIQIQHTTTDEGVYYSENDLKKYSDEIKNYLEKFHNPVIYTKKFIGEIAGLFSFLEKNDIDFFYQFDSSTLTSCFTSFYRDMESKNLKIDGFNSINQFADFNKLKVKDDLNGFTSDRHPGYFGHKLFAKKAIKFIETKLKPKLYVFGDSHTQSFKSHIESNNPWAVKYYEHIKKIPKNFDQIIGEYYDIEYINYGRGGCSNQSIFESFLDYRHLIRPMDIVVFGWTSEGRFRIANEINDFSDIIPFNHHAPQNDDVPKKVSNIIAMNRVTYNIWWKEIINYINIIKDLLSKNNHIYHWSWVKNNTIYADRIWSKEMLEDNKLCIYFLGWKLADEELRNIILKNNDVIFDYETNSDLNFLNDSIKSGKRVTIINGENMTEDTKEFIKNNHIRTKIFNYFNYKTECFKRFISNKKYMTIIEETNGSVDDEHTSEIGHQELANDIIKKIVNHDKKNLL